MPAPRPPLRGIQHLSSRYPAPHPARYVEHVDSRIANDNGALRRFLAHFPEDALLLDVGSGDRRLVPGIVTCDVLGAPSVDVICDGHRLPFAEASFDGLVLQSVLEHVLEPRQVIGEAARVLRPGGRAYVDAPFLYPVHDEHDYYRWTLKGLEYVVGQDLEVTESGLVMGPATSLNLTWRGFVEAKLSRTRSSVRNVIFWMTAWLKFLDRPRVRDERPAVYAHSYVVARRR